MSIREIRKWVKREMRTRGEERGLPIGGKLKSFIHHC